MQNDIELLELAARAAGLPHVWCDIRGDMSHREYATGWNPLFDDGDAFRLGVKLGLFDSPDYKHYLALERLSGKEHDDMRAHRRAITRASAAIQLAKENA